MARRGGRVKQLARKTVRDLGAMRLRGLMIVLIIACQAAVYSGGLCARLTLRATVDGFSRACRLADLQVAFEPVPSRRLPKLDGIGGVKNVMARLMLQGAIRLGDAATIPAVVIFVRAGENPPIDTLHIEEGAYPSRDRLGVVIERGLKGRGFNVGDTITVSAYGFTVTQPIVGIARSPEFLVSTANPEMLIPIAGSLGIVYAPVECCEGEIRKLSRHLGGTDPVNQLLFLYDDARAPGAREKPAAGRDRGREAEILARLSRAGAALRIEGVARRNEQFGIRFLEQDLKMFRVVVLALVAVFSVVTLIATGISVNRVVMSQRRELGALMALGYGRGAIAASCVRIGLLLGLAGGLAGVAASPAVNCLLASTYASALGLPPVTLVFDARIMGEAVLIGILSACAAAFVPAVALARRTPVEAMRGGAARVPWFAAARVGSGSTILRAARRNLIRRPALTAATVLLGALGLGITAGFVITLTSILDGSDALLRREAWDVVADFTEPLSVEASAAVCGRAGLADFTPLVNGYASIDLGGGPGDYQLVGVPPGSRMRSMQFTAGGGFSGAGADEIVFNASFSGDSPPAPGGAVVVTSGGRERRLTVAGLISALSTGQAYVPIDTARRILGLGGRCSGFMARLGGADAAAAGKMLYASGRVSRVTLRSELEDAIHAQLAKATRLIALAIAMGAVVALAILINTMSMNILEREGEFATLMSLGYGRPALSGMVLTEALAMGIAALALAVPVAVGIARLMNAALGSVWFQIDTVVTMRDLLTSLLPPFLLLPLAALPALRHVFTLDIASVVRQRAIE